MTQENSIIADELLKIAKKSTDKESYQVMHKTQLYRIGVGARVTSPDASFFIEVIINLSDETKKVDLTKLENITRILECYKQENTCSTTRMKTASNAKPQNPAKTSKKNTY